jgi:hypothetical protein
VPPSLQRDGGVGAPAEAGLSIGDRPYTIVGRLNQQRARSKDSADP